MNYVQPIREQSKIEEMKRELKKEWYKRLSIILYWNQYRIKNFRYYKIKSKRRFES